jgi:hypothetical protein
MACFSATICDFRAMGDYLRQKQRFSEPQTQQIVALPELNFRFGIGAKPPAYSPAKPPAS